MSSTIRANVLILGLPVNKDSPPIQVPWSTQPVSIWDEVVQVQQQLKDKGYAVELEGCEPGKLAEFLPKKLKEKQWDVLVVGGGYKGLPHVVGGLETLVNTTKAVSPSTHLGFLSQGPLSAVETMERYEQTRAASSS